MILLSGFFLLQLAAPVIKADEQYLVSLYVRDSSDIPVADALVAIYNESVLVSEGTTNPVGKYYVNLSAGVYDVIVKKQGFKDSFINPEIQGPTVLYMYLEEGTGSLEGNQQNTIYLIVAVLGVLITAFSAWTAYTSMKHRKHTVIHIRPSK